MLAISNLRIKASFSRLLRATATTTPGVENGTAVVGDGARSIPPFGSSRDALEAQLRGPGGVQARVEDDVGEAVYGAAGGSKERDGGVRPRETRAPGKRKRFVTGLSPLLSFFLLTAD